MPSRTKLKLENLRVLTICLGIFGFHAQLKLLILSSGNATNALVDTFSYTSAWEIACKTPTGLI